MTNANQRRLYKQQKQQEENKASEEEQSSQSTSQPASQREKAAKGKKRKRAEVANEAEAERNDTAAAADQSTTRTVTASRTATPTTTTSATATTATKQSTAAPSSLPSSHSATAALDYLRQWSAERDNGWYQTQPNQHTAPHSTPLPPRRNNTATHCAVLASTDCVCCGVMAGSSTKSASRSFCNTASTATLSHNNTIQHNTTQHNTRTTDTPHRRTINHHSADTTYRPFLSLSSYTGVVADLFACQVPKQSFGVLLDYIAALKGAGRQRLLSDAQRRIGEAANQQRNKQRNTTAVDDEKASGEDSSGTGSGNYSAAAHTETETVSADDKLHKRAVQRARKIVQLLS